MVILLSIQKQAEVLVQNLKEFKNLKFKKFLIFFFSFDETKLLLKKRTANSYETLCSTDS